MAKDAENVGSGKPPGNFQVTLRAGCDNGSVQAELSWTPSSGADHYRVLLNTVEVAVLTERVYRMSIDAYRGQQVNFEVVAENSAGHRLGEPKSFLVPSTCPPSDDEIQQMVDAEFPDDADAQQMWDSLWVALADRVAQDELLPTVEAAFSLWLDNYTRPASLLKRKKDGKFRVTKFPSGKLPKEK